MNVQYVPDSSSRFEIVISGSGGQGIILAGRLLAETAAVYGDRYAAMTPCYGPEVRGGGSTAELIIDSNPIDYPRITRPNVLIALSQPAMDGYGPAMGPDGLVIVNETLVKEVPGHFGSIFSAPFTAMAVKRMKTPVVANMMALGVLSAISMLISDQHLKLTIEKNVPKRVLKKDLMAVDAGVRMVEERGFVWTMGDDAIVNG